MSALATIALQPTYPAVFVAMAAQTAMGVGVSQYALIAGFAAPAAVPAAAVLTAGAVLRPFAITT
jgi:hypothetical protein